MSQDTLTACALLASFLYFTVWVYVRDLRTRNVDLASDVEYFKRKAAENNRMLLEELEKNSRLVQQNLDERMGRVTVDSEITSVLQSIRNNLEHRTLKN